jgi:Na+/glutamate symporter
MSQQVDASTSKKWRNLVIGGLLILVCLVIGGILGFASGAAIGAAFTDTASDCEFEECVDAGILPGAAIGLIVGALAGGIGMAMVWLRRTRKQPRPDVVDPISTDQ